MLRLVGSNLSYNNTISPPIASYSQEDLKKIIVLFVCTGTGIHSNSDLSPAQTPQHPLPQNRQKRNTWIPAGQAGGQERPFPISSLYQNWIYL